MRIRPTILDTLLFIFILFQPAVLRAQKVEIEYLANEGVLIKAENTRVIIDGVFKREFDYLDVLPDEELSKIEKAKSPDEMSEILKLFLSKSFLCYRVLIMIITQII